jgi:hypothetical protein
MKAGALLVEMLLSCGALDDVKPASRASRLSSGIGSGVGAVFYFSISIVRSPLEFSLRTIHWCRYTLTFV